MPVSRSLEPQLEEQSRGGSKELTNSPQNKCQLETPARLREHGSILHQYQSGENFLSPSNTQKSGDWENRGEKKEGRKFPSPPSRQPEVDLANKESRLSSKLH